MIESIPQEMVNLAPAVVVLIWLNIRQDIRIEKLVSSLLDCEKRARSREE